MNLKDEVQIELTKKGQETFGVIDGGNFLTAPLWNLINYFGNKGVVFEKESGLFVDDEIKIIKRAGD